MMKRSFREIVSSACALALAANSFASVAAYAQDKQKQEDKQPRTVERTIIFEPSAEGAVNFKVPGPPDGREGRVFQVPREGFGGVWVSGAQQGGDQTFQFVSAEMSFDNKLVKGSPFSGEMVFESVQTLADGNRIVNRSSTNIYRDSQGRTRREQAFTFFGPIGGGDNQRRTVFIHDPVENSNYVLDPQNRTARKIQVFNRALSSPTAATLSIAGAGPQPRVRVPGGPLQNSAARRVQPTYPPVAKAAGAQGPVQVQITVNENGEVVAAEATNGHPLLREPAVEAARQWQFNPTTSDGKAVKVQGVLTFNFVLDKKEGEPAAVAGQRFSFENKRSNVDSKSEALGKQMIEGIEAEGTRVIDTIPAGAIGNERPIEMIRERWYSPELQMVVMTRSVDPRLGETTQKLINVNRSEPDPSLFQIPSDYTIQEGDNIKLMEEKVIRMRKPNEQQ